MRDRLSIEAPPEGIDFVCRHHAKPDAQIYVARELGLREVIVRTRRWPFSGVRVYVNGARWGWRGDASPSYASGGDPEHDQGDTSGGVSSDGGSG